MFNIVTLNNISPKGLAVLDEKYQMINDINQADGILVRSFKMHDMEFSESLKAIARAGAGVNNIPLETCSEKGIVVFNTPGANANAVKELVLAGLLLSSRDLICGINWVNSLEEDGVAEVVEKGKSNFAGTEIKGKTLGVIGLGAIGVMVANAASDLGMNVIGYDPFISVKSALNLSRKISLTDNIRVVLSKADYITLHVPAMDATRGMINEDSFQEMSDGVKILNFSRAEIVESDALEKALASGKVTCYVTDFPTPRFLKNCKVINVPHLGASTEESEENCAIMAAEQLADYLENGNITNSVNFPNCNIGPCTGLGRIAIIHKNIPNMIAKIASGFAEMNLNIDNMVNKSKGNYAYTLLDLDGKPSTNELKKLMVDGVISMRIIC